MSPFWHNFISDGKARQQPINELRMALAEACENFALLQNLPKWQRRQTLLTELKKMADYYRRSDSWQ